jgi:hypothetical protein
MGAPWWGRPQRGQGSLDAAGPYVGPSQRSVMAWGPEQYLHLAYSGQVYLLSRGYKQSPSSKKGTKYDIS